MEGHGFVLNPANKATVIEVVSKKLGITDPVAANDGYDDYVRRTDKKGFVVVDGLKNIQRFMKLRNPKIGDINLERMIDESILRELEKSGFLEQAMSGKTTFAKNKGDAMAIDGMKVIDLDSHLVGDLESWHQTVEAKYKEFLPRKLPTKDNERRKTLVGNQIMIGSELGRQKAEKKEWVTEADLTPHGRVRNMDLDGIDVAVLSPNSPALDILWFADDPELGRGLCAGAKQLHELVLLPAAGPPDVGRRDSAARFQGSDQGTASLARARQQSAQRQGDADTGERMDRSALRSDLR